MTSHRSGILYAVLAFVMWGLLPAYLKQLHGVGIVEVVLHRIVWLFAMLVPVMMWGGRWRTTWTILKTGPTAKVCALTAALLSLNWFIYVWAVEHDHVVDASLGYFINPLVNVLLGMLFLGERLRRGQWAALGVAGAGVLWLTLAFGSPPWIGLLLAASFGTYGLLRKTAALGSFEGLATETALLFPMALVALLWLGVRGESTFAVAGPQLRGLLVFAGPATGVPLLCFAAGARRIPLSLLGVLQYIGPSLQLLLAVFAWGEPFPPERAFGFVLIWAGLFCYWIEGVWLAPRHTLKTP